MIFDGWKFPNEAVNQNDFETSELYIHEWSKKKYLRNDFQTVSTPSKSFSKVGVIFSTMNSSRTNNFVGKGP